MIGIYKITNLLNGQSYIGQSICIENRINQHILSSKKEYAREYNSPIHKSIRKNNIKNFNFEILEECPKEQLDKREIYWINYYDSYLNGYNQTIGGNAFEGNKIPVCGFNIRTGKQEYFYESVAEAEYYHTRGILESITNPTSNRKANNLCWFAFDDIKNKTDDEIKEMVFNRYPLIICQLNLQGDLLNRFMTAEEANKFINGKSFGNIILCCENKRNKAHGYQWCYYKDLKDRINKPPKDAKKQNKIVYQYSKNNKFIKQWNSLTEASNALSINISKISSVCHGNRKTAGGYKWSFNLNENGE